MKKINNRHNKPTKIIQKHAAIKANVISKKGRRSDSRLDRRGR